MKWTVCFEAWNFTRQDLKSAETPTELPHILSALSSHGNRHGRTLGIAPGILTRKPPIFLRTFLANFYPENGFGGQFLSGRRIWLFFFR